MEKSNTEVSTLDWEDFFKRAQISRKPIPFGLPSVEKGTIEHTQACAKELGFQFPQDYVAFALQIGPDPKGHWGGAGSSAPLLSYQCQMLDI